MPVTRRTVLAGVAAAGALTAAGMSPVEAARRPPHRPGAPVKLTIMGTTDLHGSVFNWNYYKNA
jgi:2',3'-cyclic-nucleotide 2'-phosphodiesterase/3'-nucleotidase